MTEPHTKTPTGLPAAESNAAGESNVLRGKAEVGDNAFVHELWNGMRDKMKALTEPVAPKDSAKPATESKAVNEMLVGFSVTNEKAKPNTAKTSQDT